MRRLSLGRVAVAVLLLSACSQATPPANPTNPGATPSVGSSSTAVSPPTGVASSTTMPCHAVIGSESRPASDSTVVLGVVALPTSDARGHALQTSLSGERDPAGRLFAKQGLEVRAGGAFEIVVPDEVADRFSSGWGNPGRRTRQLDVQDCHSGSQWLVYAGGYWVQRVACLPLIVRAAEQEQRVLIGVGAPCPGQRPPPQPTQT